jgi:hypothetical protein
VLVLGQSVHVLSEDLLVQVVHTIELPQQGLILLLNVVDYITDWSTQLLHIAGQSGHFSPCKLLKLLQFGLKLCDLGAQVQDLLRQRLLLPLGARGRCCAFGLRSLCACLEARESALVILCLSDQGRTLSHLTSTT